MLSNSQAMEDSDGWGEVVEKVVDEAFKEWLPDYDSSVATQGSAETTVQNGGSPTYKLFEITVGHTSDAIFSLRCKSDDGGIIGEAPVKLRNNPIGSTYPPNPDKITIKNAKTVYFNTWGHHEGEDKDAETFRGKKWLFIRVKDGNGDVQYCRTLGRRKYAYITIIAGTVYEIGAPDERRLSEIWLVHETKNESTQLYPSTQVHASIALPFVYASYVISAFGCNLCQCVRVCVSGCLTWLSSFGCVLAPLFCTIA